MATWACEHCNRQLAADDSLRGRPIRCPFCRAVQTVPPVPGPVPGPARAAADDSPRPQRRAAMPVELVPERIVIESDDLAGADFPPTAPRGMGGAYDPRQRTRAHDAWQKREKLAPEDDAVGRTCPYCLTKLAPGVEAVICPACSTGHHSECWAENEGCCVFGCSLAPFRSSLVPAARHPPAGTGYMSAVCRGCGAMLRPGDLYCTRCGRPVSSTGGYPAGRRAGGEMNRMASESLLFGLLSLVCGPLFLLFSPLAIYNGTRAIRELEHSPTQTGRPAATAGIFLGVISAILWLIVGLVWLPQMIVR